MSAHVPKESRHDRRTRKGVDARAGDAAPGAIVVGTSDAPGTHLIARGRRDEDAEQIDEWARKLAKPKASTISTGGTV